MKFLIALLFPVLALAYTPVATDRIFKHGFDILFQTPGATKTDGNFFLLDAKEFRFYDADSSAYLGFKAPSTVTAPTSFVLPDGDGLAGEALTTDGTGQLSWAPTFFYAPAADEKILVSDLAGGTIAESTVDLDPATGVVQGLSLDADDNAVSELQLSNFKTGHGIVTETGTQVLTNKDLDGGTASNARRVTIPKNTKTNLDALTRKEATIVYGTDTGKFYKDNGTALAALGGGVDAWVTATVYAVGDVVIQSAKFYQAQIAHTSGTFATDLAASRWLEISAGTSYDQSLNTTDQVAFNNINVTTTAAATKFMGSPTYAGAGTAVGKAGYCFTASDMNYTMFCSDGALWNIQGVQPNNTPWASYTPSISQGFGSASYECQSRYDGPDQLIRCKVTNGTTAATEARIGLADNATSAGVSIIPSIQSAGGSYFRGASTTEHGGPVLIEPGVGYVTFGSASTFSSTSVVPITKVTGSNSFNTGETWTFTARVPVVGRSATAGTYSIKGIGTVFSAKISSGGTVSDESYDFINGNCGVSGTSIFTCTFNASLFTVAPNCVAVTSGITGTTRTQQGGVTSSTQTVYQTYGSDSGAAAAYSATLFCQMSGADFAANSTINASLTDTVKTVGITGGAPRIYGAYVANSTGVVSNEKGDMFNGDCAFSAGGTYTCTFTTNNFTAAPICAANIVLPGSTVMVQMDSISSTQVVMSTTATDSGGNVSNRPINVMCFGN